MDITDKKLVVIGGAGLIGSNTIEALLKEDVGEILVYDNFSRGTQANLAAALEDPRVKISPIGGDITQPDILRAALEGAQGVFHFGALGLLHCHDFPRAAFEVNIRGTFNVLEACRDAGVERLVYSSAASVYGEALEEPMTEDHPLNANNFYGASKIAAEAMARAFFHRYGLAYIGLRYMNVYGPGASMGVMMNMLEAIDRGEPLSIYGDGSQAYDFIYVGDCALANICAMKAESVNRFYNIGAGTRTTIKELAELLLSITGASSGVRYEPAGLTLVKNRIGSTARARDEIGFEASVPLAEGLRALVEWHRQRTAEAEQRRLAGVSGS